MSKHRDTLNSFFGDSVQGKWYSTVNLGDDTPLFCCFGCKSSWLSNPLAIKHRNAECEASHQDFLESLNTQSVKERLSDALAQIERQKRQINEFREIANKAKSELMVYDELKKHQRFTELRKQHAIEVYIEEFQKALRPLIYQDKRAVSELSLFKSADRHAKTPVPNNEGTITPLKDVVASMIKYKEESPYLQAALFPSYNLYMRQYLQEGTDMYINGATWLDDEFLHYKVSMPKSDDGEKVIQKTEL